jgi:hypothetical protein
MVILGAIASKTLMVDLLSEETSWSLDQMTAALPQHRD